MDEYLIKVIKIAQVKYEIPEEAIETYTETIKQCYARNYSPLKTVEVIASNLYG